MKKQKQESELVAMMFKVPQSAKEALRMEAKRQTALRGYKVTQKKSSVNNAFGRFKDFIVGNF